MEDTMVSSTVNLNRNGKQSSKDGCGADITTKKFFMWTSRVRYRSFYIAHKWVELATTCRCKDLNKRQSALHNLATKCKHTQHQTRGIVGKFEAWVTDSSF
ncbi:hypothetical protein LOAG_07210 [Loa loa]|uniref:Uncharacterized protein n=1 Tax=Loa loa TaxID=7209 RepID=A0A1S0TWI5_LOALO|nr:hypothetical protein LOAG_07210 [Loa loa]EFO21281.1 hypothetical protein LOAG_07210 [Loa loa]